MPLQRHRAKFSFFIAVEHMRNEYIRYGGGGAGIKKSHFEKVKSCRRQNYNPTQKVAEGMTKIQPRIY